MAENFKDQSNFTSQESVPKDNDSISKKVSRKRQNWSMGKKLKVGTSLLVVGNFLGNLYDNAVNWPTPTIPEHQMTANEELEYNVMSQEEEMYVPGSASVAIETAKTVSLTLQLQPGKMALKQAGSAAAGATYEVTVHGIEMTILPKQLKLVMVSPVPIPRAALPPGKEGDFMEFDLAGARVRVSTPDGGGHFFAAWKKFVKNDSAVDIPVLWKGDEAKVTIKKL